MKTFCRSNGVQFLNARFSFATRFLAPLLLALVPLAALQAQSNYATPFTFKTVAGSGGSSSSLDGVGTAASFLNPSALAVDSSGSIYIADTANNLIRKITAGGVVSTLAGSVGVAGSADGTGSGALFNGPQGIAVDVFGNVYVADTYNNTIRKITSAGVVTTLAGAGVDTSGSADGMGSAASFNAPVGVAVDGAGNVYVADTYNSTIRKITPAGAVTTLAGTADSFGFADGTGSAASFSAPRGVTVDSSGNIFVADTYNATIRKITSGGEVTTLAGNVYSHGRADGTGTGAKFDLPVAVSVNSFGEIFVVDSMPYGDQTSTIRVVTPAGVVTTLVGGTAGNVDGFGTAAKFNDAQGVAADNSGNIYVADTNNHAVRRVTTAGLVTTIAGGMGGAGFVNGQRGAARFSRPIGLAMDNFGNVLVVDSDNHAIRRVTPAGVVTTENAGPGEFFASTPGVAVDASGNIYTIYGGCQVAISSSRGSYSILAGIGYSGSTDGPGRNASFSYPQGLAVDSAGNVYVADSQNSTIRKISSTGEVSTVAGLAGNFGSEDGTGTSARFSYPVGIAMDTAGNFYVTDSGNSTIRRITPAGAVTTMAGLAENSGSADGTGSAARFMNPSAIAVDASGNVFVTDVGNHTVRKITPAGLVTTLGGETGFADFATGVGSAAHFPSPTGIAVDGLGQIYVADSLYNSVVVGGIVVAPVITAQPANQSVIETQPATFSVAATGGLVSYQWRKDGVDIAGAILPTLAFDDPIAADAGNYDVVVTNPQGSVTSSPATLAVTAIPVITSHSPLRQVLAPGESLDLGVTATGTGTLAYQWYHNGRLLIGANANSYSVGSATFADSGWYQVYVTDNVGTPRQSPALFIAVSPVYTQVRSWGTAYGQLAVPLGLSGVIAIAEAGSHALALRNDGTVVAWGANPDGRATIPAGLTGVVAIAASWTHSLALKSDGTVVAWGANDYKQTTVPSGLKNVVAISASPYTSMALKSNGTVVMWGDDWQGQTEVPVGLSGAVAIAAGGNWSLALKSDGTVIGWGDNSSGQSAIPAGLTTATKIATGGGVSLALKQDGTVVGWGSSYSLPAVPLGLSGVAAVATAGSYSLALKSDHTVVAWGDNSYGHTTVPSDLGSVLSISAGGVAMVVRDASGDSAPVISLAPASQTKAETQSVVMSVMATGVGPFGYQWRKGGMAISGATASTLTLADLALGDAGNYDVIVANHIGSTISSAATLSVNPIPVVTNLSATNQIRAPGQSLNLNVAATGAGALSYQWLHNGKPVTGATGAGLAVPSLAKTDSGWYVVAVTDSNGTRYSAPVFVKVVPAVTQIRGWGLNNSYGQINVPLGLNDVVAISAASNYSLALRSNGTVTSWGMNNSGLLSTLIPAGLTNVAAVAAGDMHALVLESDGSVVAWGNNFEGQLDIPAGLTGVVSIAAGGSHSLALKNDGTVVAWGRNYYGQSTVPIELSGVVAIAAAGDFSLALKGDGTVVAWGSNGYGQLNIPNELTNAVAISAGSNHALATKADGTVVGWGTIYSGQNNVPIDLAGVVAISDGASHSLALKSTGTVVAWGSSYYAATNVTPDLANVIAISSGDGFSLALRDASADTTPAITLQPAGLTRAEKQGAVLTVSASGAGPLSYQWRKGGVNIAGATSTALTLSKLAVSDSGNYDVVISNHIGSSSSSVATLVVNPIPVVTSLSAPRQILTPGQSMSLNVAATGTGSLSYQWLHNGRVIAGAATNGLARSAVGADDGGWYVAVITDSYGTRYSSPIFVSVMPALTQVRAWGDSPNGLAAIPAGLSDAIALAPGSQHVLALKRDGTVVAWGTNTSGQTSVPADLSKVVAVAAGGMQSLALKSDGTVVAWGYGASSLPEDLHDVVAISAGDNHALALLTDGTVVSWGFVYNGSNLVPPGLNQVAAIAASGDSSLALKADGNFVAWGYGAQANIPPGLDYIVAIASGTGSNGYALALRFDGTVTAWGYPSGNPPQNLNSVTAIAAGGYFSLALRSDGSVVGWGSSYNGTAQTPPSDLGQVVAVAAGANTAFALRDATTDTLPVITVQPTNAALTESQAATISVTATGVGPLSYQWRKNGVSMAGATLSSLTLGALQPSDAGIYDVVVANNVGTVTSTLATLAVKALPVITTLSPSRQVKTPGQSMSLSVTATGTGTLAYQWTHNGRTVVGATSAEFAVGSLTLSDGGWYVVSITDNNGTRMSAPIFVSVAPSVTQVRGWGTYNPNELLIPPGFNNSVAIACVTSNIFALKSDGTVQVWPTTWELTPPAGLSEVVAISAPSNGNHALALKGNGTVVGWGSNSSGESNVPAGLTNVVAVAAGGGHSLALKTDGTVVAWGSNYNGETSVPAGLSGVAAIAAGGNISLALKSDGTVVAWGTDSSAVTTIPVGLNNVVALSMGMNHAVALKGDGTVVVWGQTSNGQASIPAGLANVIAVAAGGDHTLALKSDGTVVAWGGTNNWGENTVPADLNACFALSVDYATSFALRDASGDTVPTIATQPASQTVTEGQPIAMTVGAAGAGPYTYQWRKNGTDVAGATSSSFSLSSVLPNDAGSYTVVVTNNVGSTTSTAATLTVKALPTIASQSAARQVLALGQSLSLSATASGTGTLSYQWIHNGRAVAGATSSALTIASLTPSDAGWYLLKMTDDNGTRSSRLMFVTLAPTSTQVRAWGESSDNKLRAPLSLTGAIAIAAGDDHSVALNRDGTITGWGNNSYGQLSVTPWNLAGVVALAAGNYHTVALKSDGTVTGWGGSFYSQLAFPAGLTDAVSISARGDHTLVLRADGTIVDTSPWYPAPAGATNIIAVAAGGTHSLVLKDDGTVQSWGANGSGQTTIPAGLNGVSAIAAGGDFSLALRNDGTVVAWGGNASGQSTVPVGLANVIAIAAGTNHALALKSNGSVVSWGDNSAGQRLTPADFSTGIAVAAGHNFSLGLRDSSADTVPVIATQPSGQNVTEGQSAQFSVVATGNSPLTYQWRKNGINITGATAATLSFTGVVSSDAASYDVLVINNAGFTASAAATLAVQSTPILPFITNESPVRQVLTPGQNLQLSVTATGTGTLSYQWVHNGRIVAGATGASLSRSGVASVDGGWYAVKVSDNNGTQAGAPFFVTMAPALTQVRAWGGNSSGESTVPAGMTRVTSVSAGSGFSLVLQSTGAVVAWGGNSYGETNVPAGLLNVVAVSAGGSHSLALKSDGTVAAWGQNYFGQTSVPSSLKNVAAIAAGGSHSLALKSDGTVAAWGNGTATNVPAGLANVVTIAAGFDFSLALKADGTVVGWGNNSSGQISIPAGLIGVTAIAAGSSHALALKSDGTVVAWGSGPGATVPAGMTNVIAVTAGVYRSLALKTDGAVVQWGTGNNGEGIPPNDLANVLMLSAGSTSSLALRDGTSDGVPVIATQPADHMLNEGQSASLTVSAIGAGPIAYQWRKDGFNISRGTSATLALTSVLPSAAGSYDVVVSNFVGSVTSTAVVLTVKSPPLVVLSNPARQVANPGQSLVLGVTVTGSGTLSYQWKHNGLAVAGATGASLLLPNLTRTDGGWYVVSVTDDNGTRRSKPMFVQVVPAASRLVGWGDSANGKNLRPNGLINPLAVAGGDDHSIAINGDGTAVAWGFYSFVSPPPANLSDVVAVAAGSFHTLALRSDGTVLSWGYNTGVPAGLTDVVSIAAGGHISLGARSDGSVVSWGSDGGIDGTAPSLENVVSVSAGWYHYLALKSDGTVVAWGTNTSGNTIVPAGLTNAVAVAAGTFHSLALKGDGTVVAWGANDSGQTAVPAGLTGVVAIAAGGQHSMALKADGTVVLWGRNDHGESTIPVAATNVFSIAAGEFHSLALRDATSDAIPFLVTQPAPNQTVTEGQAMSFTISVGGGGPYFYQWRKNGVSIPGATNSSYAIASAGAGDTGIYSVTVANTLGSVTTDGTALMVGNALLFTLQPSNQTVNMGTPVAFLAAASGTPAPTYQWRKNGVNITGATNASYTIAKSLVEDVGAYSVVVTNSFGSITSYPATLSLTPSNGGTVPEGFDIAGYFARYPDVAIVFGTDSYGAWLYYRDYGIYEGEVFDDLFRVEEYLTLYPELFAIFGSDLGAALDHWLSTGRIEGKLGRIPGEFSADGYFTRNPDVAIAVGNDPLLAWGHYWLYGIYEGRAYDEELRVFEYLAINADLTAAFVNDWRQAALHWMRYGRTEGRLGRLPLTFSVAEYLNRSPDVAAVWGTNPTTVFLHFWLYGIDENRTYDDLFRPDEYMTRYPDVAAAVGGQRRGAFKHWVRYGLPGGRIGRYP